MFLRIASAKMMRNGDIMMEAGKEEWEWQAYTLEEQAVLCVGFTDMDYATNFVVFQTKRIPPQFQSTCLARELL